MANDIQFAKDQPAVASLVADILWGEIEQWKCDEMWSMDELDSLSRLDSVDVDDSCGLKDCCLTVPENYDCYDAELVDNYRDGSAVDLQCVDAWTGKDSGSGPTLAELNAGVVGLQDEFEHLEQFAVSDTGLMSRGKHSILVGRQNTVSSHHQNAEPVSTVAPTCGAARLSLPLADTTQVHRDTDNTCLVASSTCGTASTCLATGSSWRCQIVPHSPVDKIEQWKTSSGPVLKICKRSLSQFEAESSSNTLTDATLHSSPSDHQVRKVQTAADVRWNEVHSDETKPNVAESENSCTEDEDNSAASSDEESVASSQQRVCVANSTTNDLQKRYFWLYNVQAKGPKGRTTSHVMAPTDPHVLYDFRDPALDDSLVHKGRRSSGSDVDANPRRLLTIGAELQRLGAVVSQPLTADERTLSAREKNKFASRICRLKRKAQHEANKIKLQGLEREHNQLMKVLTDINSCLIDKVRNRKRRHDEPSLTLKLETLMKTHLTDMIAEHTDEYVKCILDKVSAEQPTKIPRRTH